MELIEPVRNSDELRCEECGRPLWTYGTDLSTLCRSCSQAKKIGRPLEDITKKPVVCLCGNHAIVEVVMTVHNPYGTPIIYLEPLCFPCWQLELELHG